MLNIKLICVGKLREKYYIEAFQEYAKRLGTYCRLDCLEIAEQRRAEDAASRAAAERAAAEAAARHAAEAERKAAQS